MKPIISVITPSIRPDGLKVTWETLRDQTFTNFEWLPRLSVPKQQSDLCYQMNKALDESQGELIVFLQDYIRIPKDGLERMYKTFAADKNVAITAPVGKVKDFLEQPNWDWRHYWKSGDVDYQKWEIDWGAVGREALGDERFFERYDEGFGWENVDLGLRLANKGVRFVVDKDNGAVAFDHDAAFEHPYKKKPNIGLWAKRKAVLEYVPTDDSN